MEESLKRDSLADDIESFFELDKKDIKTYSPLALAYLGDAVYEIIIRTIVVKRGNAPVNKLNKKVSGLVRATAQKEAFLRIIPYLTEEEETIYKRGRNSKLNTTAKNAKLSDYRIATGYESLLGYLYLSGRTERLFYLIEIGISEEIV